jgi:1-acyl-sn-glycerol-3-phosphate acyltransferase
LSASLVSPPRPDNYVVPLPRHDAYDPEGSLWPLLKAFLILYRVLMVGRVRVTGREHIPREPCILVSNHAFVSDAFIVAVVFGRLQALAQAESFALPFFGWLLARAGQIPVIRGRRTEILARAADQIRRGRHVLVYPEGQLSHGGDLHVGRTGAAELSLTTGAPILPVGFFVPPRYGRAFRGRHYNRPTLGVWQIGGPCYIHIDHPWRPFAGCTESSGEDLHRVTHETMAHIEAALDRARRMAG